MELDEHVFLEELLALRRDTNWEEISTEMNDLCSNGWNFDYCFDQTSANFHPNSSSDTLSARNLEELYNPLCKEFSVSQMADSAYAAMEIAPPLQFQADYSNILNVEQDGEEEEELGFLADEIQGLEVQNACKMEPNQSPEIPLFNVGTCSIQRKNRAKKLQGQPSKNLMAERRRRKRLNDRLSMLRSIVPKISKMDRTAILADAIEYMKELLEKISKLQREVGREMDSNQIEKTGVFKNTKPNEYAARNSPKFEVESKNGGTRIEICCAGKPGLLLSTVNTIETVGLEIQQCVISCFNEFALQASCSEEVKQKTEVKPEELKEALFRNAGYGGSCL